MLDYLSKQISAVGGIALVACSLSGEGLLSKGESLHLCFPLMNQMRTLMHSLRTCEEFGLKLLVILFVYKQIHK